MKSRIYWILFTTSFVPVTVFSQTINLDSSDSFNGENGGTFIPKNTDSSAGTVYVFDSDVKISDAGKGTSLTGPCFQEGSGALYFLGNHHALMFENLDVNVTGNTATDALKAAAAIAVTKTPNLLTLANFSSLDFINAAGGGVSNPNKTAAIRATGMTLFMNNQDITFTSCVSNDQGGAIRCRGCMLADSTGNVLFDANRGSDGGAISAIDTVAVTSKAMAINIERNQGKVTFSSNQASGQGGAICAKSVVGIADNNQVIFSSNQASGGAGQATGGGGAIFASDDVSISGNNQITFSDNKAINTKGIGGAICAKGKTVAIEKNKSVVFDSNSSIESGGAIHAGTVNLSAVGDIKFINNKAIGDKPAAGGAATPPTGGAIHVETQCTLSADEGNIIFDGNKINTVANEQRNAINCAGNSANSLVLRAKQNMGIFFYDPITSSGTSLAINDSNGSYTGDIVFSGATLTEQEKANSANLKSTFAEEVTLKAGTLRVKSSAEVEAKTFVQTPGSFVVMDVGTKLTTKDANTDLSLNALAIDMDSLTNATTVSPATITSGKSVSIQSISLVSDKDNAYEHLLFGKDQALDVINAVAATGSTVTLPSEMILIHPKQHYGYQGTWKIPQVTPSGGATTATLTARWTYSGYIPHPERKGGLVPNTLWGAFSDIRVIQNVMRNSASHELSQRGIWGAGLGSFLRTSSSGTSRQFSHSAGGYLLGISGKPMFEDIFSLGFYQMFGKDKDYSVMKNHSTMLGGAIYYQHGIATELSEKFARMFSSYEPVVVQVQFSYNHAKHDEKTTVTSNVAPNLTSPITVNGKWGNDCFGIEVGSFVTMDLRDSYFLKWFDQCHPFIKCQFVYIHQEDFAEDNALNGRSFDSAFLSNFSIPMGVILEKRTNQDGGYTLSVTYSPDAYRENPKTKMFLLADPTAAYWETKATNLARQSLAVTLGQHFVANSRLEFFANGGFEIRGSSRAYNVDIRSQFKF